MAKTYKHAIIACHPDEKSFTLAVANRYAEAVRAHGHEAIIRDLYRMKFNPVLKSAERRGRPAKDVEKEWGTLGKVDVFVLVYPIWFGTPPAMLKGYIDRVEIVAEGQVVAAHRRSYGKRERVLDPLHYLATLERRPAAVDHAPVYRDWKLPEAFVAYRRQLERRHGPTSGVRHFARILQLLGQHPAARIAAAIAACHGRALWDADSVAAQAIRLAKSEATAGTPGAAASPFRPPCWRPFAPATPPTAATTRRRWRSSRGSIARPVA